jgi:hypothetical protein
MSPFLFSPFLSSKFVGLTELAERQRFASADDGK